MTTLLGKWTYLHGAGCAHNRKIEFYNVDNQRIEVLYFSKKVGKWNQVCVLQETDMCVEQYTTQQKIDIIKKAKLNNEPIDLGSDKDFTDISIKDKLDIIRNLEPQGPYKICITNNTDDEGINHLLFFRH